MFYKENIVYVMNINVISTFMHINHNAYHKRCETDKIQHY